ncbi:hypothetical protein [Streptomyces sp. NPDC002573]|uniref:hypothetical protein n=1 Tax=Streptomyces sp. NPDC002573 TaxID=3364651 RepID=UPI00368F70D7
MAKAGIKRRGQGADLVGERIELRMIRSGRGRQQLPAGNQTKAVSCSASRTAWLLTRCIVFAATAAQSSAIASGIGPRRRRSAHTPS